MRSIKCVIIGDGAVGKTSLLISYTTNSFPTDYVPTVFDNYSTTIAIPNGTASSPLELDNGNDKRGSLSSASSSPSTDRKLYKINLWDTAGQEDYDRLRPLCYPQTDIFLICFSVSEHASFANVTEKWLPELKQTSNIEGTSLYTKLGKYPILLVGTKSDLRDDPATQKKLQEVNSDYVSQEEIDELVQRCGFMGYTECSAATQAGVREVFEQAVRYAIYEPESPNQKSANHTLTDELTTATTNTNGDKNVQEQKQQSHHNNSTDSTLPKGSLQQEKEALNIKPTKKGRKDKIHEQSKSKGSKIASNNHHNKQAKPKTRNDKKKKKSKCVIL
ncbi:CEI_1a_G0044780.mRNA.1.CDS.1 [Saccharomyces cerevisiae]|nr:CEI_1a_G0044780.mRNA.1.CDS.1 [Saccharomyces cerevisiae]CAI4729910.1 AMH_1a_G0044880.mRNA.1.CDS.1 [Saccharomyces cerevisiae]CAI6857198.1 AMH_1a_G0044880.mRNA.1.CDS.1 [Saccharomyces cerevisiae]CAI7441074.1 CEI_1a_G0044780.mRNA.1.CDS.1 [Saccharomyces cerevisiae]